MKRTINAPKKAVKTIKRAYARSVKNVKNHPVTSSLGLLTVGAGLASGMYYLYKTKKH